MHLPFLWRRSVDPSPHPGAAARGWDRDPRSPVPLSSFGSNTKSLPGLASRRGEHRRDPAPAAATTPAQVAWPHAATPESVFPTERVQPQQTVWEVGQTRLSERMSPRPALS